MIMTTLTKWNAFNEPSLINPINDLFDEFANSIMSSPGYLRDRNWRPTSLRETDNEYIWEVELPRFKKDEVKVEALGSKIRVVAKSKREDFSSSYVNTVSFKDSDAGKTDVKLSDGVLTVKVPKIPKVQPKLLFGNDVKSLSG